MRVGTEEALDLSRALWDECADRYEQQIVSGHPDIVGLETFEEDFLDAMLRHLVDSNSAPISLMDIGCGSGRLHLRYLIKTARQAIVPDAGELTISANLIKNASNLKYDPVIAKGLTEVWGIDFSPKMLALASAKMALQPYFDSPLKLSFIEGSAYDLQPAHADTIPISVSLINTIGIMKKPESLFKAMRRQVEAAGGIACIFCYKKASIISHGLSNYESTLDVSGQPKWLVPTDYAGKEYNMIARRYKLAHSRDPELVVDVFNRKMQQVKTSYVLRRDPAAVDDCLRSGHIETHTGYESRWYDFAQIGAWIDDFWQGKGNSYHLHGKTLDPIRAEPEQIAIFDPANRLNKFLQRYGALEAL